MTQVGVVAWGGKVAWGQYSAVRLWPRWGGGVMAKGRGMAKGVTKGRRGWSREKGYG